MLKGYKLKGANEYTNGYLLSFIDDSCYIDGLPIPGSGYRIAYMKSSKRFIEVSVFNERDAIKELGSYIKRRNIKNIKQYSHGFSEYAIDDSTTEIYKEGFNDVICNNELEYLEYVINSLEE